VFFSVTPDSILYTQIPVPDVLRMHRTGSRRVLTPCVLKHRLRIQDKLKDKQSLQIYGFLYLPFRPNMWSWQILMLFRRVFLCALMIFISPWPHYQLGLGLLLMLLSICLQYSYLPYIIDGMNVLDCWALLSISAYMISGFTFISEAPIHSNAMLFIIGCLLFITTSTLCGAAYIVFQNYKMENMSNWNHRKVTNYTVGAWWKVTLGINANLELSAFFDVIGGRDMTDVRLESLENLMYEAGVTATLGEGMAHLLTLVLDENSDALLSSEEIYRHLWCLPETDMDPVVAFQLLDGQIEKDYFDNKFPTDAEAIARREKTGTVYASFANLEAAGSPSLDNFRRGSLEFRSVDNSRRGALESRRGSQRSLSPSGRGSQMNLFESSGVSGRLRSTDDVDTSFRRRGRRSSSSPVHSPDASMHESTSRIHSSPDTFGSGPSRFRSSPDVSGSGPSRFRPSPEVLGHESPSEMGPTLSTRNNHRRRSASPFQTLSRPPDLDGVHSSTQPISGIDVTATLEFDQGTAVGSGIKRYDQVWSTGHKAPLNSKVSSNGIKPYSLVKPTKSDEAVDTCSQCGSAVLAGREICNLCRNISRNALQVDAAKMVDLVQCTNGGKTVALAYAKSSLQMVPTEESIREKLYKCKTCNALLQTSSNFCNGCGQKVRNQIIPKLTLSPRGSHLEVADVLSSLTLQVADLYLCTLSFSS